MPQKAYLDRVKEKLKEHKVDTLPPLHMIVRECYTPREYACQRYTVMIVTGYPKGSHVYHETDVLDVAHVILNLQSRFEVVYERIHFECDSQ